jgi:carbonic anhydrase
MKKLSFVAAIPAAFVLASITASGGEKIHWGYSGDEGPENWGQLAPEFALCSTGKNQSPIDLAGFIEADLSPIDFRYTTWATEILNNGHTVQVNFAEGSSISLAGHAFALKQFHFHAPSENQIDGQSFPMEVHLVHADKDGHLAVVAVVLVEGMSSEAIAKLWKQMPKEAGDKHLLSTKISASELLPGNKDYYRFNGSLTTPPCTEGVWWLVMKDPVAVSKEQIETFSHVMHHANNRPVQSVNARPVLR